MRKPLLKALIIFSLILTVFTACDHNVYMGEYVHHHWYYVQSDGAWQCKCGHVLEGTEKPYITFIKDRQPTEIIDLTVDPPINVVVGAGNLTLNEAGAEMAYTNSGTSGQEVYIRTNSATTNLTINAAPDIVYHYGTIGLLDIEAVAGSSYHERGKAAFAQIANGRMVLDSGSDVRQVHLKRTGTEEAGEFNNITLAKAESIVLPKITRDPIQVDTEKGTLVVAMQEGTAVDTEKDYYWLTAVGVFEQVVVSDNSDSTKTSEETTVYASDSEDSEQVITAHYIANTFTSSDGDEEIKVSAQPVSTDEKGTVTEWSYVVTGAISGEEKEEYEATKQDDNTVIIDKPSSYEPVETTKTNGISVEELETAKTKAKEDAIAVEEAEQEEHELIHVEALAPTCTEDGYTSYDYFMDGEEKREIGKVVIPALGHSLSWTYDDDYHWLYCPRCGHTVGHEEHELTILFRPGSEANTVVAETACEHTSCKYTHTSNDFPSTTGAFSLTQSYNGVFAQRTGESTWTLYVSDEIKNAYASCKWFNSDCSEQLPGTSTDFDPIEVTVVVDGVTEWVRVYCLYYDSGNNLAGGGYVDICK